MAAKAHIDTNRLQDTTLRNGWISVRSGGGFSPENQNTKLTQLSVVMELMLIQESEITIVGKDSVKTLRIGN